MRPSNNLKNNTPSDTYWRVELVFMKVQNHSSSQPWLECGQDWTPLMNQGFIKTLLSILGVTEYIVQLQFLEGKAGKGIPESSRL